MNVKKICAIFCVTILACKSNDKQATNIVDTTTTKVLTKEANSDSLSTAVINSLNNYYALKQSVEKQDANAIDVSAKTLATNINTIPLQNMKADAAIVETAKVSAQSVVANTEEITTAKTLEDKQKGFNNLTENLYQFILTIQFDKQTMYHFNCSKVFNNQGASWLDNSLQTTNPYLPKTNDCKDLSDSLGFKR